MAIELVIAPTGTRWDAWADGTYLGSFRTPLLSAARKLLEQGADPDQVLAMRHKGQRFAAMTASVGCAAALAVREDRNSGPAFVTFRSNLDALSGSDVPA